MSKKQLLERLEQLYEEYSKEYKRQCDPYYMGAFTAIDVAMQEVEKLKDEEQQKRTCCVCGNRNI